MWLKGENIWQNIYFFRPISLNSERFVFTMTQLSTFSGSLIFTSRGLQSWQLTVSPLLLSEKNFQAKAFDSLGMIVLLVMLRIVKIGNILFETRVEKKKPYMAKGWSTDNWLKNVKHSFSSTTFTQLIPKYTFTFFDNILSCSESTCLLVKTTLNNH